ncbi:DUF1697 domain-containing protein [Shewanella sp.]|uniref:DUF1697 domain-containing protein n=1 Tax=Shewanella sp. TaxID=50422 RepID=UPI004053A95E
MQTYIILLRGINVGGNNLLPMKALTQVLTDAGFSQIKTYIQTGNILLQSPHSSHGSDGAQLERDIAKLIDTHFGFTPNIMQLSLSEFSSAAANNPYKDKPGNTVHCYFCKQLPSPDEARLKELTTSTEEYHIQGRVLYLHAPDGIGRSKLAANIEKCLKVSATARNLNTVNKLLGMVSASV